MHLRAFQDRYPSLTNSQVARLCGCTLQAVKHWRSGRRRMPPAVHRLLEALDTLAGGVETSLLESLAGKPMKPAKHKRAPAGTGDSRPEAGQAGGHDLAPLLVRLSNRLSGAASDTLEREYLAALRALGAAMEADSALIAVWHSGMKPFRLVEWTRRGIRKPQAPADPTFLQRLMEHARDNSVSGWVSGEKAGPATAAMREAVAGPGMLSACFVPFLRDHDIKGCIAFFGRKPRRFWHTADEDLLVLFGRLIADAERQRHGHGKQAETLSSMETLLNTPEDGAYLLDADGVLLAMNEAGARRLSRPAGELIGLHVFSLFDAGLARQRRARLAQALSTGRPVRYEDQRNGRILMNVIYPVRDTGGRFNRVVVVVRDITEDRRKDTLDTVVRYATDLESIEERMGCAFFRWRATPDYPVEFASQGVAGLLGYTADDLTSGRVLWTRITHPDDIPRLEAELASRMQKGELEFRMEYRMIRADGAVRWMADVTRAVLDAQGNPTHFESLIWDDHERKTALNRLREERSEWMQFFQSLGHPALILDTDFRVLEINDSAVAAVGHDRDACTGRHCWELMHVAGENPPGHCPLKALLASGQARQTTAEVVALGRPYLATCTPILDADNRVHKVVHVMADLSESRRMEQLRTESANRKLHHERVESLERMAAGIAHQFNNCLMLIAGSAEEATSGGGDRSIAEAMQRILDTVQRASTLTHAMVTYTGLGKRSLQSLHLTPMVSGVCRRLSSALPQGASLSCGLASEPLPVMGDASQLECAIENLVRNAIEALPPGAGRIHVTTGRETLTAEALTRMHLGHRAKPGEYGLVRVQDNGAGMAPPAAHHAFDPFFTTKHSSIGLGLTIVHGVATGHGGAIQLQSAPDSGTAVTLFIPLQAGGPEPAPRGKCATPPGGTILVVDDEEGMLKLLDRALKSNGYHPVMFHDGADALAYLQDHIQQLDAALLDVRMPGIGGYELLLEIRQRNPRLPVFLMSGMTRESVHDEMGSLRIDGFLHKPFSLQELIMLLRGGTKAAPDGV